MSTAIAQIQDSHGAAGLNGTHPDHAPEVMSAIIEELERAFSHFNAWLFDNAIRQEGDSKPEVRRIGLPLALRKREKGTDWSDGDDSDNGHFTLVISEEEWVLAQADWNIRAWKIANLVSSHA